MIRIGDTRSVGASQHRRATAARWIAGAAALAWVASAPTAGDAAPAETRRDPRAVAVAESVMGAIAPDGAWQKVGVLRFTFSVVRGGAPLGEFHHLWEPATGMYRVEWKDKEGVERIVIFDVTSRQGRAWQKRPASSGVRSSGSAGGLAPGSAWAAAGADAGAADAARAVAATGPAMAAGGWKEVEGTDEVKKLLERAYGRFINDTYWLLMPMKMEDPGVNLAYDGEKEIDGADYDVVKLTFNGVGLTPGDTYWVYVNRKTHLVERWEYILEGDVAEARKRAATGGEEAAPKRTLWLWRDWQQFGPIRLSTLKTQPGGDVSIMFKDVAVLGEAPAGAFDPPR
jgi:hypothetical protein